MANTDPVEWRLVDTDFTTDLGILPSDGGNLYVELNEPGSGELKIPLDSAMASTVTTGMMAKCYYRGAVRGAFLIDNLNKVHANAQEGEGRWLSLSGRGALAILDEGIIMDDGTGNTSRNFTGTKASILRSLIDENVADGACANVTYDFTNTLDSDGVAWTDSENLTLPVGTSLLDVVRQFAATGIDFDMEVETNGDFTLHAYNSEKGSDLSSTVYFRVGTNCEEVDETGLGIEIRNDLLVKYRDGFVKVTDATSATAYRKRKKILNIEAAQSAASATTYAAAKLEGLKDPKRSLPIKVYDGVTPYVFVTYNTGDYIKIDRFGTESSERIRGMQLSFDEAGYAIITITLNDTILENEIEMGRNLDWLMNQWNTAHDANLLEVRYWAALGDPNESYDTRGSFIMGDKLYVLDANFLRWYDIINGGWSAYNIGASETPRCMTYVGTDIYIGGLSKIWKFETATETLTTLTTYTGTTLWAVTVGTSVFFAGSFTSIGTVAVPNGVIEYDTTAPTWTDIAGGAGTSPNYLYSDGTYLYIPVSNEVWQWDGASWTQLDTCPEDADNILCVAAYGASVLFGTSTGNIYEWDGAAWSVLTTVTGTAASIGVYLTDVYVSGTFTAEGTNIAVYRGGAWWALEEGLDSGANIRLYESNDNVDVYVIGNFTLAGGKEANEVAVYYNNFEALSDYLEKAGGGSFNLGEAIHKATAKTPMVAADEMPLWDSITQRLRKITWANILLSIKTYTDTLYVALTGNQTVAGVKTFSSDPIIPDEAYDATAWNGSMEPPTKNAVRDKIESMGGGGTPGGSTTEIQFNNAGAFDGSPELTFDEAGYTLYVGETATSGVPSHLFRFDPLGRASHTLYTWGTGLASYIRFIFSNGTKASPTATAANDPLFEIRAGGYDAVASVGNTATGAKITAIANENYDATHHGADVEIHATPAASTTLTKILSILGSGHLNIGVNKEYRVNGAQHPHVAADITDDLPAYVSDEATIHKRMLAGRDTYTWEDFDGSSVPATFAGWAGSPFVTPDTVDFGNASVMTLTDANNGDRAFLYRSAAPTTGRGLLALLSFASGADGFIGLRIDDGSDNNYVECGLYNDGTDWKERIYYRTGGGSVTTNTATSVIPAPIPQQVLLNITGTRWSSWGLNGWLSVPLFSAALAQKNFVSGTTGLTWTPTRIGITFRNITGTNTANVERFGY